MNNLTQQQATIHYCIDCGKNIVHSAGATCDLCMAELNEDYSMYDAEVISVYKFRQ